MMLDVGYRWYLLVLYYYSPNVSYYVVYCLYILYWSTAMSGIWQCHVVLDSMVILVVYCLHIL
jgi:hypothetical protein